MSKIAFLRSRILYASAFAKFKSCGKGIWLSRGGKFVRPEEITFGSNIFINEKFHISARNLVFGNNILIGPNLVIECDDHIYDSPGHTIYERQSERIIGEVIIKDDVWIGANVTLLKNAIIQEGCIIAANSLVNKKTIPYTIYGGTPAKPLKPRFKPEALATHLKAVQTECDYDEIIEQWKKIKLI